MKKSFILLFLMFASIAGAADVTGSYNFTGPIPTWQGAPLIYAGGTATNLTVTGTSNFNGATSFWNTVPVYFAFGISTAGSIAGTGGNVSGFNDVTLSTGVKLSTAIQGVVGTGAITTSTSGGVVSITGTTGTSAGTFAAGNDSRFTVGSYVAQTGGTATNLTVTGSGGNVPRVSSSDTLILPDGTTFSSGATYVGGTGVTISSGTVNIGQDVSPSASPTFVSINGDGTGLTGIGASFTAGYATNATNSNYAINAMSASNSSRADNADKAGNANYATSAGSATVATWASTAASADYATSAGTSGTSGTTNVVNYSVTLTDTTTLIGTMAGDTSPYVWNPSTGAHGAFVASNGNKVSLLTPNADPSVVNWSWSINTGGTPHLNSTGVGRPEGYWHITSGAGYETTFAYPTTNLNLNLSGSSDGNFHSSAPVAMPQLILSSGSNNSIVTGTLTSGSCVIANTLVTGSSAVMLTYMTPSSTAAPLGYSVVSGTLTVTGSSTDSTSTFQAVIFQQK